MPPSFIVFLLVIGVVQGLDSCVVFPYLTTVLFTLTVSVDDTPGRCPRFCRDHVSLSYHVVQQRQLSFQWAQSSYTTV